jgi:hypothetical protein
VITTEKDIPTNSTRLEQYFTGFGDVPDKVSKWKAVHFYMRTARAMTYTDMKQDYKLYQWLQENQIYFKTHSLKKSYDAVSAGFICKMNPSLHRRNTVKELITNILHKEVPHLIPNTIKHQKDPNKCRTMQVVEFQTDRNNLHETRKALVKAFQMAKADLPKDIFFAPSPTNEALSFDTYYKLLEVHHQYTANIRSFAITNFGDLQTVVTTKGKREKPLTPLLKASC